MDTQYLSLVVGVILVGIGWLLGRIAKVFTNAAEKETESKLLWFVWKFCWLLAVIAMLASFIVAFMSFMPYIQDILDWAVSAVYFK